ncbi:MAG TPA: DDE-type integrase/transposase/recombinase [Vicinamibacterales bacterium]|nr:DDE-type integrase/transposase/recombinase [Vicinamibacterales bacterium]
MSARTKQEYLHAIYPRYRSARRPEKQRILTEFCAVTGYHRKHAIRVLNRPAPGARRPPRVRARRYGPEIVEPLRRIWEAAGYPWSIRLKALLPLWLPWARRRLHVRAGVEQQLLRISPRQMDRQLAPYRRELRKRLYGRTKPGTLLKHHIPLRTDRWDVAVPGFTEIDLVAHCGSLADGEFVHSLNLTDIHTTWVETGAVLGKSQAAVQAALEDLRQALPFPLRGIDSDNGSEFINQHLWDYCQAHEIQFTRGRPYKKDDNAHIEQKNWTHVRKLLGYVRYDTPTARTAIHALYRGDLRLLTNFFLPSVKLVRKTRIGSRIRRVYDAPQTPLDRVLAYPELRPEIAAALRRQRARLDPFTLARGIERQLDQIYALASARRVPAPAPVHPLPVVPRRVRHRFSIKPSPNTGQGRRSVTSRTAR